MRKMVLAALAATILCGAANAAVVYTFGGPFGTRYASFTLTTDDYIGVDTNFTAFTSSSNVSSVKFSRSCGASATACDYIAVENYGYNYYYFVDGAFLQNGVYQTTSINPGTLTVSGSPTQTASVPEPASWAMMIAGFGAIGAAMRRRQNGKAQASCAAA